MSNPDHYEPYQAIADGLTQLLYERVLTAEPVEVLSATNNKLLQVVQAPDGEQFVTRSYTSGAVRDIEARYGIEFTHAWQGMNLAFKKAGIETVSSHMIETKDEFPFIIVSEYLQDGTPLQEAPTEAKLAAISGLARLLLVDNPEMPAFEMIREDMFMAVNRDGRSTALVTDMDPLVTWSRNIQDRDDSAAMYINTLAELVWDHWGNEGDRQKLASAAVGVLGMYATREFSIFSQLSESFMNLHAMTNGNDRRPAKLAS